MQQNALILKKRVVFAVLCITLIHTTFIIIKSNKPIHILKLYVLGMLIVLLHLFPNIVQNIIKTVLSTKLSGAYLTTLYDKSK